jgi:hypothetical protein
LIQIVQSWTFAQHQKYCGTDLLPPNSDVLAMGFSKFLFLVNGKALAAGSLTKWIVWDFPATNCLVSA